MAQRTIHYLFGEIFSKQIELKDQNRFLLGSVLPDAYADVCDRDSKDDLYLGYYMHLVEDAFYRQFIYSGEFKMPCSQEEVAVLHKDYHILNSYIVNKYKIQNVLEQPIDLAREPISKIAAFRVNEFIDKYIPLGVEELQGIQSGKFSLQAPDYAWARKR